MSDSNIKWLYERLAAAEAERDSLRANREIVKRLCKALSNRLAAGAGRPLLEDAIASITAALAAKDPK